MAKDFENNQNESLDSTENKHLNTVQNIQEQEGLLSENKIDLSSGLGAGNLDSATKETQRENSLLDQNISNASAKNNSEDSAQYAQVDKTKPILKATGICVDYVTERGNIRACDDINLTLHRGEILGIAGESASGKSTLLNCLSRLQRMPAATADGTIEFYKKDGTSVKLTELSEVALTAYRWENIAIVMQSAMACLNPVSKLGAQFVDVILAHKHASNKEEATKIAGNLLKMVGIPEHRLTSYPHELSGGMQQRALISLSLVCEPDIVMMDEPTTAVDVVMQRQILNQILKLQRQFGFAIAFVTHDLSLLLEIADRVVIMYGGKIVEIGTAEQIYKRPRHPYARGLRSAYPSLTEPIRRITGIPGSPPDLLKLPKGCAFEPRCSARIPLCADEIPNLLEISDGFCACHLTNPEKAGV